MTTAIMGSALAKTAPHSAVLDPTVAMGFVSAKAASHRAALVPTVMATAAVRALNALALGALAKTAEVMAFASARIALRRHVLD